MVSYPECLRECALWGCVQEGKRESVEEERDGEGTPEATTAPYEQLVRNGFRSWKSGNEKGGCPRRATALHRHVPL